MDSVVLPNNNTKSQSSMDDIESLFERKVKKEFQSAKKGGSGSNVNNQSSDNSNASGTDDPENRPIPLPFN
jgi:hypothetical protein